MGERVGLGVGGGANIILERKEVKKRPFEPNSKEMCIVLFFFEISQTIIHQIVDNFLINTFNHHSFAESSAKFCDVHLLFIITLYLSLCYVWP